MGDPVCIKDFEQLAGKILAKPTWDNFQSGSNDELTLADNCEAFKRYRLRPRVLNDVSSVNLSTSVLGSKVNFPVCIAPTWANKMAHPQGEIAVAKAAKSMGTGFTLSTWSSTSIAELASSTGNSIKWMQLYIYKDREISKQIVKAAEAHGFKGVFLTVDTQVASKRLNDDRNHFAVPPHIKFPNLLLGSNLNATSDENLGYSDYYADLIDPTVQWKDLKWLRSLTKMPIVLKGVLTSEMAIKAVEHGVDGIVVSNHGGRQLDGVPATIDALSEVIAAVNGRCEVYMDGGVRTGTDVLKALALGARAVFIGRPAVWGLTHDGEEGVKKVLTILRDEFKNALQLMGCKSIAELQKGKNLVVPQSYYHRSML